MNITVRPWDGEKVEGNISLNSYSSELAHALLSVVPQVHKKVDFSWNERNEF